MINLKAVTQAVESILKADLYGYTIKRNPERNVDANLAARNKGWIGIYRGTQDLDAYTTGATKWLNTITVDVEVQAASMRSEEEAEDKLQDAETEVMNVFGDNLKLNNTVANVTGFAIRYEVNTEEKIYFHSAIITIRAEARA